MRSNKSKIPHLVPIFIKICDHVFCHFFDCFRVVFGMEKEQKLLLVQLSVLVHVGPLVLLILLFKATSFFCQMKLATTPSDPNSFAMSLLIAAKDLPAPLNLIPSTL